MKSTQSVIFIKICPVKFHEIPCLQDHSFLYYLFIYLFIYSFIYLFIEKFRVRFRVNNLGIFFAYNIIDLYFQKPISALI